MSVSKIALALVLAGSGAPAFADQITCNSTRDGPEPCGTVQPGSSVRLARQLGDRPCIEGRTWGTGPDHDSIWVSRGCSAVFDVQPPGGGYANDDAGAGGGRADDRAGAPDSAGHSPDWQRGYADGQRGNADPNATSQEYLEGFRAGEDAAPTARRYGARTPPPRAPGDNPGVFESVPNAPQAGDDGRRDSRRSDDSAPGDYADRGEPEREGPSNDRPPPDYREPPPRARYDGRRGEHYASIDQARATARQACLDAAAEGRRFGPDRIVSREVRWIGHGEFAVSLDSPEGELVCTVDRDGNVHSIDNR